MKGLETAYGTAVACLSFALIGPIGASGQEPKPPETTKILQSVSISTWMRREVLDRAGPAVPTDAPSTEFQAGSEADYDLRFITKGSSAFISAEGMLNEENQYDGKILQAWVKTSPLEGWSLNFGKKIVKWQDGFFMNPSDTVNSRKDYAQRGRNEGRLLMEANGIIPFADAVTLDVSAVVPLDPAESELHEIPLYLSCGTLLYPFEVKLKSGFRDGETPQIGMALKLSLFDIQWYVDGLYTRKSDITALSRKDDDYFKVAAGFTGKLSPGTPLVESISFAVEYDQRSDGLTEREGKAFFEDPSRFSSVPSFRYYEEFRRYAFVQISLNNIVRTNTTLTENYYLNAEDHSGSFESVLEWSPRNVFTIAFAAAFRHGDKNSEVGGLGTRQSYELTLSKSF